MALLLWREVRRVRGRQHFAHRDKLPLNVRQHEWMLALLGTGLRELQRVAHRLGNHSMQ